MLNNSSAVRIAACIAAVGALAAGAAALGVPAAPASRLLLAPMIGVMQGCVLADPPQAAASASATTARPAGCGGADGSAAQLIESTLSALGPRLSADGEFELGYTLQIPLLQLFKRGETVPLGASGVAPDRWVIDQDMVRRLVRTLAQNPRPAIVYLFSTHFGIGAPIETDLAGDAASLAATPRGPMAVDRYYSLSIYPWSIARTDNAITRRRTQAIDAVTREICRLPARDRAKVRGITLLGELHHLFPDFEAGMGFGPPYLVSDYSAASVRGFRGFLKQRFGNVDSLNSYLGNSAQTGYADFEQVDPPAKDIRTQPLERFTEHIDSFAHGSLPISGWAAPGSNGSARWIRIYLNGNLLARVPAHLGRQDVAGALPQLRTADVGWRHDLDFSGLPAGLHRIDVMMEPDLSDPRAAAAAPLWHLGSRRISVMDRDQRTPLGLPMTATLPSGAPPDAEVRFHIDQPVEQAAYWFNPLVPLWHEFRNDQVVRYLDWFDRRVGASCLWDTPRYIHQIVPSSNPGWDANKFAVDASLQSVGGIELGASLYGEPTYGTSFLRRVALSREDRWGVTEFHPMTGMAPAAVRAMLERHHHQGATFVSFFLEPRFGGERISSQPNPFSFDPDNPMFGSDRLYRSVGAIMTAPQAPPSAP